MIENLCFALATFGTIPAGNLSLIIDTQEIQVFVYTQEDKRKVVYLLCHDREIADLREDREVKG